MTLFDEAASRRVILVGALGSTIALSTDIRSSQATFTPRAQNLSSLLVVGDISEVARSKIPASINFVLNLGISGDGLNGALYRRIDPAATSKGPRALADARWVVRDALGTQFVLSEREARPEFWGADPAGLTDSTAALQAAIDYSAQASVPVVLQPGATYLFDNLVMKKNVVVFGLAQNAINVHAFASLSDLLVPTLKSSGADRTSITFPGEAWGAGICGVAVDLSLKRGRSDGIVFASGSGDAARAGHWLRDVVAFGGTGKLVAIEQGNSGGTIERCWLRGGISRDQATADYALFNEGLDWRFIGPLNLSGARTAVLHEGGGASRYHAVDCFMGQKAGVIVSGQGATFERLQTDLHGGAALEVNGARNSTFIAFKAQGSGAVDQGALVRFVGKHSGSVFVAPIIMAGATSGPVAFSQLDEGSVSIDIARISKKLRPYDDMTSRRLVIRNIMVV